MWKMLLTHLGLCEELKELQSALGHQSCDHM